MKKITIIAVLVFVYCCAYAQEINGSWKGILDVKTQKLNLVFHFQKEASGKIKCLMDSPDQGAKGIETNLIYISEDSVNLSIPAIGMYYGGKLKEDTIKGTFRQSGIILPLDLTRGDVTRNRPQNPVLPLKYKTEGITFYSPSANAKFTGTLSYPSDYKDGIKVPVVIMISGSGSQNRDEEVFDHKPFLVIADYLARHGIASYRYDDRGFAESTGDASNATTKDFATDAAEGIKMLQKMGKFSKVGIIGHSEGASIAFMLGAKKEADFVISMAGIGVKGDTALVAQVNKMLEKMGQPASMTVKTYSSQVMSGNMTWLKYFINYQPDSDISSTTCPVMAINGDKDVQVISSLNLESIKRLLPKNNKNMVKLYPGLNHLFQHCQSGMTDEYANIDETISPEVLEDITNWIKSL